MLLGREIGPFVVDREIGAGAMGAVYRGKHKKTGQKVAIKLIAPALASNQNAMDRFKREMSILKQLNHPNIVKLLGTGKAHGTPFYLMEYIKGESLDHAMERRGKLTWQELVPLGQQLCAALQYAHDKGIIHRDLKPSNLMMLPDGTLKLTDFGIAKDTDVTALTAANSTVGTASYMSPEQCRGARDLTNKSDLYSMGVMLYELVTGKKPFVAESAMEMFTLHLTGKFQRPSRLVMDVPIWLDTLICQLMEKDPEKRPFSAETVSKSLGMIKEKVEAQESAGVAALKKRRVDRADTDVELDEKDKDAARALLGKKKKGKVAPFYQKGWFTLSALGAMAALLIFGFYWVFIKADSAETLFARAEAAMKSGDSVERHHARKPSGAIGEFLERFGAHPQAGQVQEWADQIDLLECETAFRARWNQQSRGEEETLARDAVTLEDLGQLAEAEEHWQLLQKKKNKKDPDERGWGFFADKRLAELKAVNELLPELEAKIEEEKRTERMTASEKKGERMALEALRREPAQQWDFWNDLKSYAATDDANRRWYLLAAKMCRELRDKKK